MGVLYCMANVPVYSFNIYSSPIRRSLITFLHGATRKQLNVESKLELVQRAGGMITDDGDTGFRIITAVIVLNSTSRFITDCRGEEAECGL